MISMAEKNLFQYQQSKTNLSKAENTSLNNEIKPFILKLKPNWK